MLANRLPLAVPGTNPKTGEPMSTPVKYVACLVNLEGQVDVLPRDADLETDDELRLVAAVQDLSLVTAMARSTAQVVMGTGVPFSVAKAARPGVARERSTEAATAAPHQAASTWTTAASPALSSSAAGAALVADGGVTVRKNMAGAVDGEPRGCRVSPAALRHRSRSGGSGDVDRQKRGVGFASA